MSSFEVNYFYHHNCLDLTDFHKLKREKKEKKSLNNVNKSLVFNFLSAPTTLFRFIIGPPWEVPSSWLGSTGLIDEF